MKKENFYSIIIVAKNESLNIGRCIEAIIDTDILTGCSEVILVDNGSLDDTVQIAVGYGLITFVKSSLSVAGMRNFGASQASGNIYIFLDADVLIDSNWLSSLIVHLDSGRFDCAFAPESWVESPTIIERSWLELKGLGDRSVRQVKWCQSGAFIITKEAFESISGFDSSLCSSEDYDFGVRLSKNSKIVRDGTVFFKHIRTPKSIKELFWQQVWHGNGCYRGFYNQEFSINELFGTFLPNIFLISVLLALILFILNIDKYIAFLALSFCIYFLYAYRKIYNLDKYIFIKLFLILIFLVARGISVFISGKRLTRS